MFLCRMRAGRQSSVTGAEGDKKSSEGGFFWQRGTSISGEDRPSSPKLDKGVYDTLRQLRRKSVSKSSRFRHATSSPWYMRRADFCSPLRCLHCSVGSQTHRNILSFLPPAAQTI